MLLLGVKMNPRYVHVSNHVCLDLVPQTLSSFSFEKPPFVPAFSVTQTDFGGVFCQGSAAAGRQHPAPVTLPLL